jgi:two-component system sensor histidine kinase DesK
VSAIDQRPTPTPGDQTPAAASTTPGSTAAATPVDRTLALLAADGVAYLVYWLVILILLSQAATSVLRPPEGSVTVGVAAGLVCLLWSAFCLGLGILRGTRPDGGDLPPPVWLMVVTSAGCLVSLVLVRTSTGLVGPWTSELVAGGLLVASTTVWLGAVAGGVSGVLLAAAVLMAPLDDGSTGALLRTPLSDVVAGIALMAAGFGVALALVWVRRSAQQLQGTLDARDEILVREQAVRAAAHVAAEVERSLHDTALNTLETIAAHGEHLDPNAVVARCRADVDQLSRWRSESSIGSVVEMLADLRAHAERVGLAVDVDRVGPIPPRPDALPVPPSVLHAFTGAGREALTNVLKHSQVREATVLVVHSPDSLELMVADNGVGPGMVGDGFGVANSVRRRIEAVGGSALVTPGPEGVGTVVLMSWRPVPEELPPIGADLLTRMAGVVVAVGTILAGVACALVVLGWPAYAHPWPALAGPVLPVLVAAWILNEAKAGVHVGPGHVLAACATYVLVGAVALLADPYCASLLGEGVMLDARAPLVATVLLLAPRPGVLAALIATVGLGHVGTALAWNARWVQCGQDTAEAGVYVVAALGAIWLFARRLDRVTAQYAAARAQANQAEVRIRAQLSVRAEEELWVADTLSSAQELLGAIAEGRKPPADPATRSECAGEAQFLRGLLAVGRAPDALRRPARIWLRLLHAAGCQIQVRGTFGCCVPPPTTIGHVGGVLDTISAIAPGATVTISAWSQADTASLMVTASGPSAVARIDPLSARVHRVAGDAWRDFGADQLSVEWTWPHSEADPVRSGSTR